MVMPEVALRLPTTFHPTPAPLACGQVPRQAPVPGGPALLFGLGNTRVLGRRRPWGDGAFCTCERPPPHPALALVRAPPFRQRLHLLPQQVGRPVHRAVCRCVTPAATCGAPAPWCQAPTQGGCPAVCSPCSIARRSSAGGTQAPGGHLAAVGFLTPLSMEAAPLGLTGGATCLTIKR